MKKNKHMETIYTAFALFAFACFALSPKTDAVAPPPDGGYPGANTAEGDNALFNLTSGIANTAVGFNALFHNTTGGWNVGIGSGTLVSNTTGSFNMAIGTDALTNSTANYNLAIGFRVGFMNTTGNHLTGIGAGVLFSNTTGSDNTAIGADALGNNTTGNGNTATGSAALFHGSGSNNTANGFQALYNNFADGNTAIGYQALFFNTGGYNIALGYQAGHNVGVFPEFPGYNDIEIGNAGDFYDTNTIRIGAGQMATFIAGIYNVNESGTILPVYINSDGRLGTQAPSSSRRFKKEIKPMDKTSEAILSLKPVTFHYKSDKTDTPQFGLIAEDVAEMNPDLVVRDKDGEIYTVRYDAVNAMLLNEFLKEHRKVEALQASFARAEKDFRATVAEQQKQIEALTAGLQKVSTQIEASKPAPQTVLNDH